MIKVSVIVPVYKVPLEYLRECFDSLLAQTMQECEFIIVSDGALDAECSVCEEYADKDSRFIFFRREHAGVSAARNFGMSQAQGEYITFVDSDDWIKKETLFEMYEKAHSWKSDILSTNYGALNIFGKKQISKLWQSESIEYISSKKKNSILNDFILLKEESIPRGPCGKLYLREFLQNKEIQFNPLMKIGEDLLFNFEVFYSTSKLSYLNKIYYFYRDNQTSATRSFRLDYFQESIRPICEMKNRFSNKFWSQLGQLALTYFYKSWSLCYMHPQNKLPFKARMHQLVKTVKSNQFQELLNPISTNNLPFILKVELFLFRRKITFPIWVHGLKALLSSYNKTNKNT